MNKLASEHSSYLRSASGQPVHWHPWGKSAFAEAAKENKPILLDIGAVWCHWCHVMDSESYENEAVAALINREFVAIKVDRDERPDIDGRYQSAVQAISGQGGWPLTAFLLPDGRAFYGGTYFPPEDGFGRPGFPRVLNALAEAYRTDHDAVLKNAGQINDVLRSIPSQRGPEASLGSERVLTALAHVREEFDSVHGGFGSSPKFPHTGSIELLLTVFDRTHESWMLEIVETTLKGMARGGIHDQLSGGFHRYSTDEGWKVPHFEKMLYDNAPLLSNYIHAYQATGNPLFRDVAKGIVDYVSAVLFDNDLGGFFSSQDADINASDDGSYFTWSEDDVRKVLNDDEFHVLQMRFDIFPMGEMHHDQSQNVLFQATEPDAIAQALSLSPGQVSMYLDSGSKKLLIERNTRKTPFIDRTIYANWNGMMIAAALEASSVLGDARLRRMAQQSLERILTEHRDETGLIRHAAHQVSNGLFLDDQIQTARACLFADQFIGEEKYLGEAVSLIDKTIDHFWDPAEPGFLGLPTRRDPWPGMDGGKPIQDSPTPSANATAILVLLRLHTLTGQARFAERAERMLNHFSGLVGNDGLYAATFFLGLETFLHPPLHIVVSGMDGKSADILHEAAMKAYRPGALVTRLSKDGYAPEWLIPMLAKGSTPVAYVCTAGTCAPPVHSPESLSETIRTFGRALDHA